MTHDRALFTLVFVSISSLLTLFLSVIAAFNFTWPLNSDRQLFLSIYQQITLAPLRCGSD